MALSFRNPTAEKLARRVASELGMTMTQAIILSLEDELQKIKGRRRPPDELSQILAISERCAALPEVDCRAAEEILGYDEAGVPNHGD